MAESNSDVKQIAMLSDMTSSNTGTFYLAFGSNLSAHQMSLRLTADPRSSQPVALVRLEGHSWIICERGYANVVSLPATDAAGDQNTVWGILYNLSAADEAQLDRYEGHNEARNPKPELNSDPQTQQQKPYLQGGWDYNKHYLPMTVTKWFRDPRGYGIEYVDWSIDKVNQNTSIRALVYVDELRVKPGVINQEYIGRMNRAIREAVKLGLPQTWVDNVMRRFVPAGIEVDAHGYVGTDEGYVEAEATETADDVKERVLRVHSPQNR